MKCNSCGYLGDLLDFMELIKESYIDGATYRYRCPKCDKLVDNPII